MKCGIRVTFRGNHEQPSSLKDLYGQNVSAHQQIRKWALPTTAPWREERSHWNFIRSFSLNGITQSKQQCLFSSLIACRGGWERPVFRKTWHSSCHRSVVTCPPWEAELKRGRMPFATAMSRTWHSHSCAVRTVRPARATWVLNYLVKKTTVASLKKRH